MNTDSLQAPDRKPLRDILYERILAALLDGVFEQGERLRDTDLAEKLGASRTPVREALLLLANHGHLEALPGRGFRVAQLTFEEANEVYPLLSLLEIEALRCSAPCTKEQKAVLESQIQWMQKRSSTLSESIHLDQEFHQVLLSGNPNGHLEAMIKKLRRNIIRYETTYFAEPEVSHQSIQEHQTILDAFVTGTRKQAMDALHSHWQRSSSELLKLISE